MTHHAVSSAMHAQILDKLHQIESVEEVRILFAIESGSRAWGFHSPDSDYDVRFVYARPPEWHYRLGKKRDVIEQPIEDVLDISGWELSKALTLALNSNAVIAEWLQSPIVYMADRAAVGQLLTFAHDVLDCRAVTWHYLALLDRQRSRLLGPDGGVRIKRYFYVLRPTLALRWMRLNRAAMPPMDMARLREGCALSHPVAAALDQLTERKMKLHERSETSASDPMLDRLVEEEAEAARLWLSETVGGPAVKPWDRANELHLSLSQRAN